ncbi:MAG: hypothetical protein JNL97_04705, partial [Verrucomicrobiales bacterium]|nr:hypothetical protein [Verrucomicrobiales bacterium]
EESAGSLYFTRTLELGSSTTEQVVRVLEEPGRLGIPLREPRGGETTDPSVAADGTGWWFQAPMVKRAAPTTPPPTEGGIGAWSFDGSGEAAWRDGSGAARALVPESARVVGEGRSGGGLSFEAGQRVGISRAEDLDFAVRDLTVAAWIRTREDGGIFAKTSPGPEWVPGGTALFVRGGRLTFDVGWVGAVASSRGVTDGEWHHVALAWKAADGLATLYVDGEPDGTGRLKPGKRLEAHVAWLGFVATNFPASPWFRGTMDEVRLYGRTLDATEIAALAGPPPRDATAPAVAILGAPSEARWWVEGESGGARLVIPAHASPLRLQFVLWRAPETDMARHAAAIRGLPAPRALSPLTRPGPSRWAQVLETRGRLGDDAGPYAIDELVAPDTNPWQAWLRFSGIDLFRDGKRAAVSTWNGDVWIVSGVDDPSKRLTWKRIAAGLYQPLGLRVVDDEIFVLGRDQITRLQDRDGDGETDFYENFNNDARVGEHFHEFANDLKLGPDGDFYYVKCARHALPAAHSQHGSLIRVSRDGRTSEVVARGFRAVNGLGVGPRGELTTVDNQGHWMPANRINWVKPGGWYGNQWAWNPDQRTTYDEPLCWVHNFVDRSGGTHLWVPDERWGLAKDDLVTLSYGMGQAFLVLRDDVGGTMQGALTRLPMEFETGVMRGVFHPGNGHLYACGLYGWAGNRTKAGGLYRIRKTDKPLLVPNRLHVAGDGLVLGFTEPLDRTAATDPGNYDLKAWNYRWSAQYGSPDLRLDGSEGRDTWRVESATVSADGRTVFLAVPQIRPVMQIHLGFKLRGKNGVSVENF